MFVRFMLFLLAVMIFTPATASEFKLLAGASSYTTDDAPERTAANEGNLRAEGTRTTTYLRFYVGWVKREQLKSARLRLATSDRHEAPIPATFDIYGIQDGVAGDGFGDWREFDLCAANAPAYERGKGPDANSCTPLAVAVVPKHIPNKSKTPVNFESPELASFIEADKNGWITLIVRWKNGIGGNCCFHSTRAFDDIEAQPRLEIETDSTTAVDLTRETVILRAGERQIITGYGGGSGWDHAPHSNFGKPTEARKAELAEDVFKATNMNSLRLWASLNHLGKNEGKLDMFLFKQGYIDSGLVDHARTAGITRFILSPADFPSYMLTKEPSPEAAGMNALDEEWLPAYAAMIADIALTCKRDYKLDLYMTTLANESATITIRQWPRLVLELRKALDARGLQTVKIGAVDWPNNDSWAWDRIKSIQDNPAAWKTLDVVTTHSYAMPLTEDFYQQFCRDSGKEFWVTEKACSGTTRVAAAKDLAGHMLNDLNKGCTCWMYHESLLNITADNPACLVGFDADGPSESWIRMWPKYYVYRQITSTFPRELVMRQAWSNKQATMQYPMSYTPYVAAGGKKADGSFSFGLVNLAEAGPNVKPVTLQIAIEEAAAIPELIMKAHRSGNERQFAPEDDVVLRHGIATVSVGPCEVLTLRSAAP